MGLLDDIFHMDIIKPGKYVICRVDVNSPLDYKGKIMDITRFYAHKQTLKWLVSNNNRIIILAHQGRPGCRDFIGLRQHAEIFGDILGTEVKFVEDITGERAKEAIRNLKERELLLLDNVRFLHDEMEKKSIQDHANSSIIKMLEDVAEFFVLDGFAVSHRPHASVVGFATVVPSAAGFLMVREIKNILRFIENESKFIVILGGAKVDDAVKYIDILTRNRNVDKILLTGLVAFFFHVASGLKVSKRLADKMVEKFGKFLPDAKRIIRGGKIVLPDDYAIDNNGREETPAERFSRVESEPKDIGIRTVEKYLEIVKQYDSVCMRGPAGIIEEPDFRVGTQKIIDGILRANKYLLLCGGHLSSIVPKEIREKRKVHISTGGGATIQLIGNGTLPGIEALRLSKRIFEKKM